MSKKKLKKKLESDNIPLPFVESAEDLLSDAQSGRVGGVFTVGEKIETVLTEHERDEIKFKNYLEAFSLVASTFEEFKARIKTEATDSKITIKEREYGIKYIQNCIDLVTKLFKDTDAKRLQSDGAAQALKLATKIIKRVYDDEREKLRRMEEYLREPGDTVKERLVNRPTGINPGKPLDAMSTELEELEKGSKI